jgi:DNA-directed RNA polymerase subunit F
MRIDPDACRDPVLLAAEVRRLQAVIAASETLTDEEREAIEYAAVVGRVASELDREVLKGLLKRNGAVDGRETVQQEPVRTR